MKKWYRLLIYCMSGFLFVTIISVISIKNENRNWEKSAETGSYPSDDVEAMSFLRERESTNNRRLQAIEEVCAKYNLGLYKTSSTVLVKHPPVPQYSVFYFDRKNKLALCPIYKAGSSTWLFNLLLLAGMTEEEIESSGKQLSSLARDRYPELEPYEAEGELHHNIKILTVRHPFERLLSAYRDKLENTNVGREHGTLEFYKAFGSKIVKKYRKNGNDTKTWELLERNQYWWNPKQQQPAGVEPTFREFVQYLIDLNVAQQSDDHWIPYYLFCTPCLVRYDIIAKVETMNSDQWFAIHVLGLQDKIKPKWKHKTQFVEGVSSAEPSHLAKIYFRQLLKEDITQLYNKYKLDFELFDYDYSQYLNYASDYSPDG